MSKRITRGDVHEESNAHQKPVTVLSQTMTLTVVVGGQSRRKIQDEQWKNIKILYKKIRIYKGVFFLNRDKKDVAIIRSKFFLNQSNSKFSNDSIK